MAFNTSAFLQARQAGINALASGISGAGDSIAAGITEHTRQAKRLKALQGSAVDIFGMDKNQVAGMSAEDLEQQLGDTVLKQRMDRDKAELDRQKKDQEFQDMQRVAGGKFMKSLAPLAPFMEGPEQPINARRILGAAADAGFQLSPSVIAQFAQDETDWGNVRPREVVFIGVDGKPVKGAFGKGGQFQFLPVGAPDSLQAIPVFDDEGNVIGMRVPTGTGGTAALPAGKSREIPSSAQGKLTDYLAALQEDEQSLSMSDAELKAMFPILKPAAARANITRRQTSTRTWVKSLIDLQHEMGNVDDSKRDALYKRFGIAGTAAAAAAPREAQGGYKIGKRYSGITYIGGDPNKESSWRK